MLNESIINIRVELQNSNIKKSGKNKFQGFNYYELADFLPKLNELMQKEKLNDLITFNENEAKLVLIKDEEKQEYTIPFIFEKSDSGKMQAIQYLGALNTYYKRYLYLNAFGITDGEVIDGMDNAKNTQKTGDTGTKTNNTTDISPKEFVDNTVEKTALVKTQNKYMEIVTELSKTKEETIKSIGERLGTKEAWNDEKELSKTIKIIKNEIELWIYNNLEKEKHA